MTENRTEELGKAVNNGQKLINTLKTWISDNLLLVLTLVGVLLGFIIGFCLRILELSDTTVILISYPGELYMRILKLVIMPLIISSLISGCSSVNAKLNGKIALRTFTYFLLTSTFNALLGVILAVIIHPGEQGINSQIIRNVSLKQTNFVLDSVLDMGRNIVADNIFQATFQQVYTDYTWNSPDNVQRVLKYRSGINNLGIVFFCTSFGIILGTIGSKGQIIKDFFSTIFEVIMKMVRGILWITPVGLCSIIAGKIISVPNIQLVVSQLGWLIFTVILGVSIYQFILIQLIYLVIIRKNPFKYYISILQGTLTAFSAASTAAALPINMDILDNVVRIDPKITRFVLPVGCNTNLDGTAMFLAISTIFLAQMSDFPLATGTLITIWFTSAIMSFAVTSVPSSALVILFMVLSSVGIPDHHTPLLFAVDWLLDRFRTTNNMLGDCYTAAIVAKLSHEELQIYNNQIEEDNTTFDDNRIMRNKIFIDNEHNV
ncbi:excitatory amino acid transporter 2-like [Diorhabda sublineata]|uniref:excitatory amino acid transporter 2-like n=1 Tax=Diorhabda sublineata TaxID=1163346 RepID=UPI0024E05B2B|nr:excitatory amino acid transporter 2-like [Diorhabda sublineata]